MIRPRAQPPWPALAASIAVTAMVSSGSTWVALAPEQADTERDAVVTAHIRSLMAPQPTDVVSTDRHAVKPWFSGRIHEAPRVVDLAKEGIPLVGGRLDVVGLTPVPTLVYRYRNHLISLTAVPAASRADSGPAQRSVNSYNVLGWTDDGVAYWALSDIGPRNLKTSSNYSARRRLNREWSSPGRFSEHWSDHQPLIMRMRIRSLRTK